MTINSIIKKAFKRLELEGKEFTPDYYAEAFCKEAKKAGVKTGDCGHIDKLMKTMSVGLQKDMQNYRVTSMQEFTRFLISKLNRTHSSQCLETLESQTVFIKRVLQVIEVLHNEEASKLAKKSIKLLETLPNSTQLDNYRTLWVNFLTTYDSSFLNKLQTIGKLDSKNLKKTIEHLDFHKFEENTDLSLIKISSILIASLVPSIANSSDDKIAFVSEKIRNSPLSICQRDVLHEIQEAISFRISLDKNSLQQMVESIDGVLDRLSFRLIDMIEKSDNSTIKIQKIKEELELYNIEDTLSFKDAHKKLFTIAVALEENTKELSVDLKKHNLEVDGLAMKIKQLEQELEESKKESKEDFLTKIYNRRALDELIDMKEAEFKRYKYNFSIVMFDLDKFKNVNDTYGHDAGDAVISAFARILKEEAREVDIIGRYGGEEFMAVLSETNDSGASVFANKVRKHLENAKFMFKKERICITVSAGVASRENNANLEATISTADKFMYKAKKNGRNQVVSQK